MSKLLKPAELAKALDIQCANISMAVKNGTLDWDVNNEKRIDIGSLKNQMWINKQKAKGKTFDINRIYESELSKAPVYREPKVVVIKETLEQQIKQEQTISQITPREKPVYVPQEQVEYQQPKGRKQKKYEHPYDDSEANDLSAEKIRLEVEKLRNSDRLEKLKIAKLEGELLPTNIVETIFLYAVQDMKKTYEQGVDNLINIFNKKLGGEQKDFIEMKKHAMEQLSLTGNDFKENLLEGIKNAILEYSEVRGRGERK